MFRAMQNWVQILPLPCILCVAMVHCSDPQFLFMKTRDLITAQVVGRIKRECEKHIARC